MIENQNIPITAMHNWNENMVLGEKTCVFVFQYIEGHGLFSVHQKEKTIQVSTLFLLVLGKFLTSMLHVSSNDVLLQ